MSLPESQMRSLRGREIALVLQSPIASLNPALRIGSQMEEAWRVHAPRSTRAECEQAVFRTLDDVCLPAATTILRQYPSQLSVGQAQRVLIAMAILHRPALLIADEPTSALDVTIQAQVLTLMKELIDEVDAAILFISHDLGVIAETADEVGVMYAGRLVEYGPVAEVFQSPRHPYTKALLRAAPSTYKSEGPLHSIAGSVPNLSRPPAGCRFHPRCPLVQEVCRGAPHPLDPVDPKVPKGAEGVHRSACYFAAEVPTLP